MNNWPLVLCVLYSAYDLQLSDAMNDLQEQVKVEHAPTEKNEHGMEVSVVYLNQLRLVWEINFKSALSMNF